MSLFIKNCAMISHQFQAYLTNQIQFSQEEKEEISYRRIAFWAFTIIVLLGLPIWWMTTTPYRAQLPKIEQEYTTYLEKRMELFFIGNYSNDIWNNLELNSDYILHFIFIHQSKSTKTNIILAHDIQRRIDSFSKIYLQPIGMNISTSSEHFWDFSLHDFMLYHNFYNLDSTASKILTEFTTELDRLSSPPIGQNILLKIAIFFIDENNNDKDEFYYKLFKEELAIGFAIASWGGVFKQQKHLHDEENLMNAIMSVLQLQLLSSSTPIKEKSDLQNMLERHKERLTFQNLLRTTKILNALYDLAFKIEDLVISDEVAEYAAKSKALFNKSYLQLIQQGIFDSKSAAEARRWAERANGHHSLLELLNFPSDQKYGIYVPLFIPVLVPLIQPLASFLLFLMANFIKRRRNPITQTGIT